ncbi:MAG: BT4734/BF3469 family protein [Candidatus Cryptobacteroides sp.]
MEKTINRESVLRRTNWGVDIYAHILRQFYPGEVVMRITGRDCGIVRNPFAGGVQSLHIWFAKNDPDARLSDETAYHKDQFGAIPDGDALDFAELYWHQSGQELLQTINRELYLHLDVDNVQYSSSHPVKVEKGPKFSFFKAPVTNKFSFKSITALDAYNYIKGPYAQNETKQLRSINDPKKARIYKASHFAYATFCGEFDERSNDKVKTISGLLCIDFDHVQNIESLFSNLLEDQYFETVLLFRSPSGDGLKWIIETTRSSLSHSDYFRAVASYIEQSYGIKPDASGKDIARACFLPYDPDAYINPNYV